MKRIVPLLLCALLLLTGCVATVRAEIPEPTTWQEQYDLGLRYLSEGNYKQAIIAFNVAINIDPKQADAYRKAAEAYGAMGDMDGVRAILQKGIDAIGDASLQSLLDALPTENADTDAGSADTPETSGIPIPVDDSLITGTLSFSNVTYTYEHGGRITEMNEGAVGGLRLEFNINGPADVRDVLIASWREVEFTQDEIRQQITMMVDIWRGQITVSPNTPPFSGSCSGPIDPEERGLTQYYLLIGLDQDGNAAGYAVIPVDIP